MDLGVGDLGRRILKEAESVLADSFSSGGGWKSDAVDHGEILGGAPDSAEGDGGSGQVRRDGGGGGLAAEIDGEDGGVEAGELVIEGTEGDGVGFFPSEEGGEGEVFGTLGVGTLEDDEPVGDGGRVFLEDAVGIDARLEGGEGAGDLFSCVGLFWGVFFPGGEVEIGW